ncbi:MAG: hypothetical protein COB02_14075 [Candidatus Cloacimonadota bacterium]|nr:MAG: hypothetical protein COB02_14075 [Candidatus Cloacimonadota bacterium]
MRKKGIKQDLSSIINLFEQFSLNDDDVNSFYSWRELVDKYLKASQSQIIEEDIIFAKFYDTLYKQLFIVPSRWSSEKKSIKTRLHWVLEDLEGLSVPSILRVIRKFFSKSDTYENKKAKDLDYTPQVILSSYIPSGINKSIDTITDTKLTFKTRFRACESQEDYVDFSHSVWNQYWDIFQTKDPQKIYHFVDKICEIYPSIVKKVNNNDLLVAFMDTFPYLLQYAHQAPYNLKFIELARFIQKKSVEIINNKDLNFKGHYHQNMDELIQYYFQSMFSFFQKGSLTAFIDLYKFTLDILENYDKFEFKYFYLPVVSELYYWIPEAYIQKIGPIMLDEVRLRIKKNKNSNLRSLLGLSKVGSGANFDRYMIVSEFLKEIYKDRNVSDEERLLIKKASAAFQIPTAAYRRMLREVFRELRQNKIVENEGLNSSQLMARLIRMAQVDGKIDAEKGQLLYTSAKILGIDPSKLGEITKHTQKFENFNDDPLIKGFRRLGWEKTPSTLMKNLEIYKWSQTRLESFQRFFSDFLANNTFIAGQSTIKLSGEIKKNFDLISGEFKIAKFDQNASSKEELAIFLYSDRKSLRKWFEIISQIDYIIFDSQKNTFSIDISLLNIAGKINIKRNEAILSNKALEKILELNHSRYRLFLVDGESNNIVYSLKTSSYLHSRQKVGSLFDAFESGNSISVKVLSQMGQKKEPEEAIYYHAQIENILFLSTGNKNYDELKTLCKKLIKEKFPDDYRIFYYLAYICFETNETNDAFIYLLECLKRQNNYKEAMFLYAEKKLNINVLDPRALGYLKQLDLGLYDEEKLSSLYKFLEKQHTIQLRPLLAKSRLLFSSQNN